MSDWNMVLWSEARDLAQQAGISADRLPEAGVAPRAHFVSLRGEGERTQAVSFLAAALPRAEAIGWGAACLEPLAERPGYAAERRNLLDYAMRWIEQPCDEYRRTMFAQAEKAQEDYPERLLGYAIYFSGGSISDPDLEPVSADPAVTGHLVAAAIQAAAVADSGGALAFLDKALDLGEKVAVSGQDALTRS